jgi:hypothetical protein
MCCRLGHIVTIATHNSFERLCLKHKDYGSVSTSKKFPISHKYQIFCVIVKILFFAAVSLQPPGAGCIKKQLKLTAVKCKS